MGKMNMKTLLLTILTVFFLTSNTVIASQYDYNDLAVFSVGGPKYGYLLRKTGEWIIPPLFDGAREFGPNGLAVVGVKGKFGFIDMTGKIVIEPQFTAIGDFRDGMAMVFAGDEYGFVNDKGELAIIPQFSRQAPWILFNEGLAAVYVDGKWGYINKLGKMTIEPQFKFPGHFSEGLAVVATNGKVGFIDNVGDIRILPTFDEAGPFREGLASVKINNKWGFINKNGHMVIEAQFDKVENFNGHGLAAVKINDKWGFINKLGKVVILPQFHMAFNMSDVTITLSNDGKFGVVSSIDKIVPAIFTNLDPDPDNGYFIVQVDGKCGYVNERGEWLVKPIFSGKPKYWPKQGIVELNGYYYDTEGNKLNHYVNHMSDGYKYYYYGQYAEAQSFFYAALSINPGDNAAIKAFRDMQLLEKSRNLIEKKISDSNEAL